MTVHRLVNLGFIAALAVAGTASGADWPMFMGDARHAGHVSGAGLDPATLHLAWRFDTRSEIRASPVVAGGVLFAGAENGNLYAIDLATRKLRWLYHAAGGISSTPAVAGGVVYFLSRDGLLHAVGAADGAPRWRFRTQGEAVFSTFGMYGAPLEDGPFADPWDFYLSSPLVHDGKVYVGSSDQRVYALDAASGKLAWTYKTGGMIHSSPALAGPNIVVGSWDGAVVALDAASGALRWRYQTETEQQQSIMLGVQASPTADRDTVYIGSRDGHLYALDAASGALKWRYDAKGAWIAGTAAQDEDSVYVGTSDTNLLLALDKHDGHERLRVDMRTWTFASPLRVGTLLVGASMKGELRVLDAASGRQRWSYRTDESAADAFGILAADGKFDTARLYAGGPHALQSALEHVKRLGAFIASPLWHDGQLIAANANGEILFFECAAK